MANSTENEWESGGGPAMSEESVNKQMDASDGDASGGKERDAAADAVAEQEQSLSHASYNYVRRRKCNENVPVCEKKKKRESYRRVSRARVCRSARLCSFVIVSSVSARAFLRQLLYLVHSPFRSRRYFARASCRGRPTSCGSWRRAPTSSGRC